jgi:hypothetical protein
VSVKAEALAAGALVDWLRMKLPAKVTEVNAARGAVLRAPAAGPYTIPDLGGTQAFIVRSVQGVAEAIVATAGSRTAAQIVTSIGSQLDAISVTATADSDGRLVFTSSTAPTSGTPSKVALDAEANQSLGMNTAIGFDAGGDHVINTALVTPAYRNVMDGWPQQLDATSGFIVVVGRRTTVPVEPNPRRDEHIVTLELAIFRPAVQQENHRSREHISACVQCVREVLQTDAGLQLGRASSGDIVKVEVGRVAVEGMRFQQMQRGKPFGPAFDSAAMTVYVKTFERPAAS